MADTSIVLGSVTFKDFEIPSEIAFGGEQALSIKKLPGGARVIDALGEDDDDIPWSGRFQGADTQDRIWALHEMRKGGQPQTLTVAGYSYTVVVRRFVWRLQKLYQALYDISLTVVQDNTQAPAQPAATLDDVVGSDLGDLVDDAADATDPSVLPAVSGLQGAIDSLGQLEGATLTALAPIQAAAANVTSIIADVADLTDGTILSDIGSVAGIVAGGSASVMVTAFGAQLAAIDQMSLLKNMVALSSRIQINLAQSTG